jgi:hypothetical protein
LPYFVSFVKFNLEVAACDHNIIRGTKVHTNPKPRGGTYVEKAEQSKSESIRRKNIAGHEEKGHEEVNGETG